MLLDHLNHQRVGKRGKRLVGDVVADGLLLLGVDDLWHRDLEEHVLVERRDALVAVGFRGLGLHVPPRDVGEDLVVVGGLGEVEQAVHVDDDLRVALVGDALDVVFLRFSFFTVFIILLVFPTPTTLPTPLALPAALLVAELGHVCLVLINSDLSLQKARRIELPAPPDDRARNERIFPLRCRPEDLELLLNVLVTKQFII